MEIEKLDRFLDKKPIYYKKIDHKRVKNAYNFLKSHIDATRTVHLVGTNGKGSIGRIMAYLAHRSDLNVGHFSSPHILKYNERFWLNGVDASEEELEEAHQSLYAILGEEMSNALSYFEYSTLLAFVLFQKCDLIVLEAGLGGEFDATNVCEKELSVITTIGLDHQSFLGDSIEKIANTKIRSIAKLALIAPQIYDEVYEIANDIALLRDSQLHMVSTKQEYDARLKEIANYKKWPYFLTTNAATAMQSLDLLSVPYNMDFLLDLDLFGRFYPLKNNVRIDVGHNIMAANAIVKAMQSDTVLIYNSLDDKDYKEILRILKPKIKRVEIMRIKSQRAATTKKIESALMGNNLEFSYFDGTISSDEEYLVFGSFYVVEEFLKMTEDTDVSK